MTTKKLYITTDASDNSITLSKALFQSLSEGNNHHIFVFKVGDSYGFISLIPTVSAINYNLNLSKTKNRIEVSKKQLNDNQHFYYMHPQPL